jgi:diguanylate cyclase (GGDEF)-like protein
VAFRFTVSMGVACCQPGDISIEQTIGRADHALYRAKTEGRDRTLAAS